MSDQEEPAKAAPIDPSEVIESFTGWDEIAIENQFKRSFATMGESSLALRVAEFVVNRRSGMKDREAFKAAMDITYRDLTAKYDTSGESGDEPGEA